MIQRNKNFWTNDQGRMNFDRLACWRNDPDKWSNETVHIVSSWRHVKYFGKLKWDRVHSMLIHLSGSTAPHEKPYMSPQVSSMKCEVGLWRKFESICLGHVACIASRVFRVQFWLWGWVCQHIDIFVYLVTQFTQYFNLDRLSKAWVYHVY